MARVKGKASQLGYGTAALGVGPFTAIGQILEITPPTETVDDIDTTHMGSTDGYAESEAGWIGADDCSATIQFAKAQLATLYTQLGVEQFWQILYGSAGGPNDVWFGFLSEISPAVERAGIVTVSIKIAVSGRVVSAATYSAPG